MTRLIATAPVTLISDELQGSAYDLEIVTLNADRYVIGYGHTSVDSGLDTSDWSDLQFEIRGFDGSVISAARRFTVGIGGDQTNIAISEGPDGVFAVGWYAQNLTIFNEYSFILSSAIDTVRLAVFNPDGTVRTPEAAYEPGGYFPNWAGVAVGWTALAGEAIPLIAGSAIGTPLNLTTDTTDMIMFVPGYPAEIPYGGERAGYQTSYQIVSRPDGDMTLAWLDGIGGVYSLRGGILDVPGAAGTFSAEWFVPLTGFLSASGDNRFEVIVLALGQTVVSYYDDDQHKFRVFEADGSGGGTPLYFAPTDAEITLAIEHQQLGAAVAALPDGGFVAIWAQGPYVNAEGVLRPNGFWTRTYDAAGNATGDGLLIREFFDSTSVYDVDIDVSDDGTIVAGWRTSEGNTHLEFTETRVLSQVVEVEGTTGDDTLDATHRPEDFIGLAGIDMVSYLAATAGVSASLAPGMQQTGDANEDRYDSIENLSGSNHADDLRGDDLANVLNGLSGEDTLSGAGGDDTLMGGSHDDLAYGGEGHDVLAGEGSSDTLYGGIGDDTLDGGGSADTIHGDEGADSIRGGTNNDLIYGGTENDTIRGDTGNDTVYGGSHEDQIFGDDGNDSLFGDGSSDLIFGWTGNDTLDGGSSADTLYGDAGADSILGGSSNDSIFGGTENDTLEGGTGKDTIYGGSHNDLIDGGDSADRLFGDGSADTIHGGEGTDSLDGGSNTDLLYGGLDADTMRGGTGNDTLYGGSQSDKMYGDANNDELYGDGSSDTIYGGDGNDLVDGGSSADVLYGGSNNDTLIGGSNNDTLYGGASSDTLTGGTGSDVFVFSTGIGASIDTITDFSVPDDTIWLEDSVFAGLSPGALEAAAFVANPTGEASTVAHRLIYDTDSGALYFDADGNGAGARVQFAALTPGLSLTHADFLVV